MRCARIPFLIGLCSAVLGAIGCEEGGGPGDGPVAFEDYCGAYAEMTCQVASDCDCLEGYPISTCELYQSMDCRDEVEAPVNAGLMTYDAQSAGLCLQRLWAIAHDCSLEDADWPEACDAMLVGAVAENGACGGDDECLPGLECYGDRCIRLPTAGQTCHPDYGCASGHYCGEDGLCHLYQGAGGPCPEGDLACDSGLYCDSRVDECAPYLGANESCAHASWACDSALYCSESAGQVCRPYPGVGGDCADSYGSCVDGAYCGADDLCHAQKADGAECVEDEECLSWDCTDLTCEAESSSSCPF